MRRGRIGGRRVVLVGEPLELAKLAPSDFLRFGIEEIARVAVNIGKGGATLGSKGHGRVARAIQLSRELGASEFVLVMPWSREHLLEEVGNTLRLSPLPVRLLPDHVIRSILARHDHALSSQLAIEVQRAPLTRWERAMKRALDLSLSLAAVIVLSPFLLMVAAAVRLDSKGPATFRQRRGGFDSREFVILKFRTMTVQEDGDQVTQARREDARITPLGRLLRRSSIDELPQLFNVIRGDMSLVGPRPHAMAHDDKYGALISSYALRHHVKPGLTGISQIMGLRGETLHLDQMQKRVEADLWYINNWSLMLDLKIMVRTCLALLRHDAY
jgi:undecaprenyl-phosphate galactose phosphotransferase/putative colanic acid biosynthesis UDP-glucose lipid carrier transferase